MVAATRHGASSFAAPSDGPSNTPLDALLRNPHIWRGNQYARVVHESIPTGFESLDKQLPGGGWPRAALTEILTDRQGIGELSLLMPALSRLSRHKTWIAWIAAPHIPYAPALCDLGVDTSSVVILHTTTEQEKIWAAETCLRSQACSAVLLWAGAHTLQACRRLQLAAEAGQTWGVVFGPNRWAQHTSPATLRLVLSTEQGRLKIHLLKRRGGGALPELFVDTSHEQALTEPRSHTDATASAPAHAPAAAAHLSSRLRQQVA